MAQAFFANQGVEPTRSHKLQLGIGERKKSVARLGMPEQEMDHRMKIPQVGDGEHHFERENVRVE
jgi:hypothetical protein